MKVKLNPSAGILVNLTSNQMISTICKNSNEFILIGIHLIIWHSYKSIKADWKYEYSHKSLFPFIFQSGHTRTQRSLLSLSFIFKWKLFTDSWKEDFYFCWKAIWILRFTLHIRTEIFKLKEECLCWHLGIREVKVLVSKDKSLHFGAIPTEMKSLNENNNLKE